MKIGNDRDRQIRKLFDLADGRDPGAMFVERAMAAIEPKNIRASAQQSLDLGSAAARGPKCRDDLGIPLAWKLRESILISVICRS